jgi:(2Fe-2S) ferredoxin
MGLCADGPNLIIYPQKIWLSNVRPEDVPDIVSRIEALAGGRP